MKELAIYYIVLSSVIILIALLSTYLIYLIKKNRVTKGSGIESGGSGLLLKKDSKEDLTDLQARRIEYLKSRENDKIMREGFNKFENIVNKMINDEALIKEAEEILVKNTRYKYHEEYPYSKIDDSEENKVLEETEHSKLLTEYWEKKGVTVIHYIYSGIDERFINIILELNRF